MPRDTYVLRDGALVLKSDAEPIPLAPYVHTDTMADTWHPANGRHYDSKSSFRRATKDAGCIEVGTERLPTRREPIRLDRRERVEGIKRAIYELRNGR